MLDVRPEAGLIIDDHDVIIEVNAGAENLLATPAAELVGLPVTAVVRGLPVGSDGRLVRSDGVVRVHVAATTAHAWLLRLAPDRLAVLLLPAPEAFDAQSTLALVVAALEQSPDSFEITDESGHTEYANPAISRLLGRDLFNLLGCPVWAHVEKPEADLIEAAMAERKPWQGEVIVQLPDGQLRVHDLSLTPVTDRATGAPRFVVFRRDVTERVRTERELEALRQQVATADRRGVIGQVASVFAHDVNNPATFIDANVRLARDELTALRAELAGEAGPSRDALDKRLAYLGELLADAATGSARVVRLAKRLAVPEPSADETTRIALAEIARSALRLSRARLKLRARIVEALDVPAYVRADPTKLVQVVVNLLTNAIDAIPPGDSISHQITISTRESPEFAELTVRDTGVGISAAIAGASTPHAVIAPDAATPGLDGRGLSLTIARQALRAFGGTLTATRLVPTGSEFAMRLPRATGSVASG